MNLRDITKEAALLKSYKTVFVDNPGYELLRPYRNNSATFPVFLDRVFTTGTKSTPQELIDYRLRKSVDDKDIGRLFILERDDTTKDTSLTRLFWVWVSPAQVRQFADDKTGKPVVNANIVFHPLASLEKYPAYWTGGIDPLSLPNYLELGARYLCKEKVSVTQHFCAVSKKRSGATPALERGTPNIPVIVVVPVSSPAAYLNLASATVLSEVLRHIGQRCYEGVTSKVVAPSAVQLGRVAVSGYSRSGVILKALFDGARPDDPFMTGNLKEVYAFDIMLDVKDAKGNVLVTKKQGYDAFWAKVKAWQGDDSDRMIRLYSAEPATVSSIYAELTERRNKYGGGYHAPAVKFSAFNGKPRKDGTPYANLSDGYEIYSTDNSRSLVVLPSGNSLAYISTEGLVNPAGFPPGAPYEDALEGHSWFVSRLQSHALFHSGF